MPETLQAPAPPQAPSMEVPPFESQEFAPHDIPPAFAEAATKLFEETTLETRGQLKAEAAAALSPTLEAMDEEAVPSFLDRMNAEFGGVFSGQDLLLLSSSRENTVMVNTNGRLEEVPVASENAKDVLLAVKAADGERKKGHSYGLRHEIIKRSAGAIPTCEAFTYADELPAGSALDAYLDDESNWVPERAELQQEIVAAELEKAHEMSDRLQDEKPTVYALRGNTAAGKTTAVKSNPIFVKAIDEAGETTGSINPDTYKNDLRRADAEGDSQVVSHFQAHEEGAMIARKINASLASSESSMVIDKRMSKIRNLAELMNTAEAGGKDIKILDVDVPLELSLVRVLEREVGGEDPNVPFDSIAVGFAEIRGNRKALLQKVAEDDKIVDYVLRVADETGRSVEVVKKVDGELTTDEAFAGLLEQAVDSKSTDATIENLGATVITDEYVNDYISRVYADDPEGARANHTRASLNRYRGKTLRQAIDERANTLNE